MNPSRWLMGLAGVAAVSAIGLYAYINLSGKTASLPQTATISGAIINNTVATDGEKTTQSSSSAVKKPALQGFNEKELKEGLDNIKAGLDLLENPFE